MVGGPRRIEDSLHLDVDILLDVLQRLHVIESKEVCPRLSGALNIEAVGGPYADLVEVRKRRVDVNQYVEIESLVRDVESE